MPAGPPEEEGERANSLLVLWAEAVADFACLPRRCRAQVLFRCAREVERLPGAAPDREQAWHVHPAFGFGVSSASPRMWRFGPAAGAMRVIGVEE
jgi:hypothetical protein